MKLIFLNRYFHPDISATSQMLSALAFHLARQGEPVHVITSRQRYDDPAAGLPRSEVIDGVQVHRVRTTRFGRAGLPGRVLDYASFYAAASLELAKLAGHGDIVIAKTDPPLISVAAAFIAWLRGAHLVNWIQDLFPEVAERMGLRIGPFADVIRLCRNASLRRAATNVVLGDRMRALVEAATLPGRCEVVHNWADGKEIVPLPRNANGLRREWGLEGRFVVAYAGNMGRAHEFATILDAAEVLQRDPRFLFLFVGGGHQRARLEDEAKARNLANVAFKPYQSQDRLSQTLGLADLHLTTLLPAMEGLIVPSKIYGILAAGRPTVHIGDPDGEIAGVLASAQAGYTVPIGRPEALAQRIAEFAADPALIEQLGRNARTHFDAHYSQRIAFAKWEKVLAGAASASPA